MNRGDVVRLPSEKRARGHEQRGARFGVVVQSNRFDLLSTAVVAPTSRSMRDASFRPRVEIRRTRTLVLTEQLRSIDTSLLGEPVGRVTPSELEDIDDALRLILDLPGR